VTIECKKSVGKIEVNRHRLNPIVLGNSKAVTVA